MVNNASAMSRTPVAETDMKRYDLMQAINTRGTFMVSKYAIPHLEKAANPHILMISPPLDMKEKWFAGTTGYSIAKFGMSLVALGLAGELRGKASPSTRCGRAPPSPPRRSRTCSAASGLMRMSRTPEIMADAAYAIFHKPAKSFTGHFLIDDSFLAGEGVTDFEKYRADAGRAAGRHVLRARRRAGAAARREHQRKKVGVKYRPHKRVSAERQRCRLSEPNRASSTHIENFAF